MGHIWLIYGLYMGYLREYTMVAALLRQYKYLIMYWVKEELFLSYIKILYLLYHTSYTPLR